MQRQGNHLVQKKGREGDKNEQDLGESKSKGVVMKKTGKEFESPSRSGPKIDQRIKVTSMSKEGTAARPTGSQTVVGWRLRVLGRWLRQTQATAHTTW